MAGYLEWYCPCGEWAKGDKASVEAEATAHMLICPLAVNS